MSDPSDKPFAQQPLTIAAAAVVLVVLICLGIVLFGGLGNDVNAEPTEPTESAAPEAAPSSEPEPDPDPETEPDAPLPTDSAYNSACGLSGGTTTTPTTEFPDLTWEETGGWYFPISDTQGPGQRKPDGPWDCFAQTPSGAVLAAYTIPIRLDGIAEDWPAVLAQQTVPGVAQTAREGQGRAASSSSAAAAPKGFVVDSYTNEAATISFYLATPTVEATCSARVEWSGGDDGDWLLRLESDGSSYTGCIEGAPSRYVPWGPTQ